MQMQRSRDEGNLAKIDNTLAQSYGDFLTWSQDKQADQLLPEWEKRKAAAMKQFDALPFSETGKAKAQVLIDNKTINYTVDVSTTARKRQIQNADREMEAAQKRAEMMGDFESSAGWLAKRKAAGHIDSGTEQQGLLELDKKQQLSGVQQRIALDPFAAEEHFNAVLTEGGGKSKEYDLLDAYAFMQARDNARSQRIQTQRQAITTISDLSLKNPQGINDEQIRQLAEQARIPQENVEALINNWKVAYDNTPEGQAVFVQKQNDLFFRVRQFQPEIDNATGELTEKSFGEYMALDASVRANMPAGYIERFTAPIERRIAEARKKNEGKLDNAQVIMRQQLTQQVNLMRKHGILGNDGGVDSAGKPVDYPKFLATEQKQAEVLDAVEGIFERNPSITADEAFKQFQDLFNNGQYGDKAAQEFFRGPDNRTFLEKLGDWFGASANPTAGNPNVMAAGLSWGTSSLMDGLHDADEPLPPVQPASGQPAQDFLPAPQGSRVTSYNWKGDPYADSNSRKWIGSFGKINENGMAISPDVERQFKAAGIKPKDPVELTLSDGTTVVRIWDNRTMQDRQAIRKFGKPLTGRFDFHHPTGNSPHEKDGVQVVSFRKADT
jgi:hypothetical protein